MDFFDSIGAVSLGAISLGTILSAIVIFLICCVVIKVLLKLISGALERTKLDGALKGFIKTASRAVLWVLAIIIIAGALGIDTASLVAVVSIAGLALSLSIQNVMSNLFSGITLLITHPFKAGDYVEIGSSIGNVKSVGLFYTVVDTLDNKTISIPNSDVTASAVTNYSAEPLRRVDLLYSVPYDSPDAEVRAALLEAPGLEPKALSDPAPFVGINSFGAGTTEYTLRVWCRSEDYWDVYFSMNDHMTECLNRHNVHLACAHTNVRLVQ